MKKKVKNRKKTIYLGIDGVILTRGVIPALHLDKFLKHILDNYSVYWLSTRCPGDSEATLKYLSQFLPQETLDLAKAVKPTSFHLDKTEAIDFNRDFFWLENQLFDSEKNALKKNNKLNAWIELDLIKSPNQLYNLVNSKLSLKK